MPDTAFLISRQHAARQRDHTFSHLCYDLPAVRYHKHRRPAPVYLLQKIHDLHRIMYIQVSRRLVRQKYLRRVDQRTGNRNTLLLAARELVRVCFIF